jgi:hypothetical protein
VVHVLARLRVVRPRNRGSFPVIAIVFSLFQNVQTGFGDNLDSHLMGAGECFHGGKGTGA